MVEAKGEKKSNLTLKFLVACLNRREMFFFENFFLVFNEKLLLSPNLCHQNYKPFFTASVNQQE